MSTIFYSDQGESGATASATEGEDETTTKSAAMNRSAVPMTVDGHGHGPEWKSGSEISHSTVSTVVGGVFIQAAAASSRVIANTTTEEERSCVSQTCILFFTTSWTSIHCPEPSPVSITLGLLVGEWPGPPQVVRAF